MTVLRIDNDDGSCRLEIPGANRRWSLILLRVPSFNGFSAYVTPQGRKARREHSENIRVRHQRPDFRTRLHR